MNLRRFWQEVQGLEFLMFNFLSILVITRFILEKLMFVVFLNLIKAFISEQVYLSLIWSPLESTLGCFIFLGLLFLEFLPMVINLFL